MANKPGLADLKKLRKLATESAAQQPAVSGVAGKKTHAASHSPTKITGLAQGVSSHDLALFRQTMRHVHPIKDSKRAVLRPAPLVAAPVLQGRRASAQGTELPVLPAVSDTFVPATISHDAGHYLKQGLGPDVLKNLKRDKWPIEASLDLHGSTQDQARLRLEQFLLSCVDHGVKCVRIVHGKGYGSKDGTPVLKEVVRRWMTQFDVVLAYTQCNPQNGGDGALQALLKTMPAN